MGGCSSCRIFEQFSRALVWICKNKLMLEFVSYLLHDFCFTTVNYEACLLMLKNFCHLFRDIGVSLSPNKSVGPTACLAFPGVEIDSLSPNKSVGPTACLTFPGVEIDAKDRFA